VENKVLGRGLGELLAGKKTLPGQLPAVQRKTANLSVPGPGLRVLLQQRNGAPVNQGEPAITRVVALSLFLADLLVLVLACLWFAALRSPGLADAATLVLALSFGAWLGFLGCWLHFGSGRGS
jgi:hypothetical protein